MDIQFPPFLQKGDKVVIVSPSSKIDQQFLKGAKKRMESWGLKVAIGKHAGSSLTSSINSIVPSAGIS